MSSDSKIRMLYRPSHYQMPVIAVIEEMKLFEKFGLDVDLKLADTSKEAEKLLLDRGVDVVIGNHVTPMSDRVKGVPIVYLAQVNNWTQEKMITSDGNINNLSDLKGKRLMIRTPFERHPSITVRLHLVQAGLDPDKDLEIVPFPEGSNKQIEGILEGHADAVIMARPFDLKAQKQGLKVVEIPQIPMICGLTILTFSDYAKENGDKIKGVIKGLMSGVAYFKKNKADVLPILKDRLAKKMGIDDDDLYEYMYTSLLENMVDTPYPTLEAIQNVYQLALWIHPEVKDLNPLSMWDLHFVREVDEEGFIG